MNYLKLIVVKADLAQVVHNIVYIVEMLRYGNREAHSYVSGVYSDRKIAEYEAQLHMNYRGGKYYAEIHEEIVDGCNGKSLVCRIDEFEDDEELENAIKSRKEWLNYREKQLKIYEQNKKQES